MKYLVDYTQEAQSVAMEKHGAFFAFGKTQFEEKRVEGVKYVSTGWGMICPKENLESLLKELEEIQKAGIKQDIEENGLEAIIKRELSIIQVKSTMLLMLLMDMEYPANR